MHELSIAASLVDIAQNTAHECGARSVEVVHLRLGPLSGVVRDSLLFAFDIACKGTLLEGSRLDIEDVPLVIFCPACHQERTVFSIQSLQCPVCGAFSADICSGTELDLISLEISDYDETDRDSSGRAEQK